ncbi:MAG: molybdopterin-dependent oxidoreductase [Hyphomicrobiales bacterium]|nr:molybdopterin-dependent oxidoreductase [Hyphomicrobiales bacterium]
MTHSEVHSTIAWSAGPGCHGGCGQKLFVEDGKLVRIEGDEANPWNQGRSCPRVLALKQYMYHPDRITRPLKRVGQRGEGKFEPISWDEAFDTCERRLREIRDRHGAESVVFVQGTGRDIGGPITLLAYSFGSPNWVQLGLSGHSCYTPRLGAMKTVLGDFAVADCSQFLEKRYDDPQWQVPEVIITWGQNPTMGCPDGFYGYWIVDCMRRGSRIIAVDPRNTWMTSRAAHHLQLRPGTDGALALGMLNIIIEEGIYDQDFVTKWVNGFDELKERVRQFPLDRVAALTEIPATEIVAAARLFAKAARAAIQWGVPVDMCPDGTTVAHAITCLSVITGNIDIPGGQVIARPAHGVTAYPFSTEELVKLYGGDLITRLNEKRIGADAYPMVKSFRGWAQPDMAIEQIESGEPYPIKGAWVQTANVVGGQSARAELHLRALQKLDFIAVVDLFHNPTTMALADIILPAATFPEKDSIRSWWAPLAVIKKRVQVGECKSDVEINFELAKRFNPEGMQRWGSLEDLFNERLEPAGTSVRELVEHGGWRMPVDGPTKPYRRHERGLLRADGKPGFNTASGKAEVYNETFKSWGLDPLPFYTEPPQSEIATPELFAKYPLVMITGARSQLYFHAEHRMIPWLREKLPDPTVEIHPDTAKRYGVADGEWIYLENDMGRVKRKVQISRKVRPHHVHTMHGWWLPELDGAAPSLFGVWDYQINKIIPGPQCSKSGFGGGQYKTTLCTLRKIAA